MPKQQVMANKDNRSATAARGSQGGTHFNNGNTNNRRQSTKSNSRNHGNNNKNRNDNKPNLAGETEELGSNVYFIGSFKQQENYDKTTEAILKYIQGKFDYGVDVVKSLEDKEKIDFDTFH